MVAVLVAGALTGLLFDRAKVPGGLIIGAMIGSAAVSLYRQGPAQPLPPPLGRHRIFAAGLCDRCHRHP